MTDFPLGIDFLTINLIGNLLNYAETPFLQLCEKVALTRNRTQKFGL